MVCFVHFDLQMCFAHLRATTACPFRHLNYQKWSEHGVLCTFWLRNVLSTSQLPKVIRTLFFLCILTWKRASRHNGVQLFISHLARWLCTRRCSDPTFRPSGATNHWKNSVSRLFYLFAHLDFLSSSLIFFLLLFSSLSLPISAFHQSILSEVWLLNFLRLAHRRPFAGGQSQQTVVKHRFLALGHVFYGISLGFLWDFHDVSIRFLWYFYGITLGFF